MTIHVPGGGTVYTGPVGGDGPWTKVGYTTDGMSLTVEGEEGYDPARTLWKLGERQVTMEVKLTRQQLANLWRMVAPRTRNRRRNPLHAVRDRLRAYNRARAWAARGARGRR